MQRKKVVYIVNILHKIKNNIGLKKISVLIYTDLNIYLGQCIDIKH